MKPSLPRPEKLKRCVAILCLLLVFLQPGMVRAGKAVIDDVLVTPGKRHLLLYCRVRNCFTEKMNRAILSGIPTTFTFRVQLSKHTPFWFNQTVAELRIEHTVKYDALKNRFSVTLDVPGEGKRSYTVREYFRAKNLLAELDGIRLVALDRLAPDATYRLRIRAELDKVRLPFYLHYILFFVSMWDFETDWYEASLTYEGKPVSYPARTGP